MEKKNILKIGIYDSEVLARELREGMKDKLNPDIQIRYTSDEGGAITRRAGQGDFDDIYMISEGAFLFNPNGNPQQVILANYIRMIAGEKPLIVAYDFDPIACADPNLTGSYAPFEAGIYRSFRQTSQGDRERFYQDMANLLNTSDLKQIVESRNMKRLEEIAMNSPIFRLFRNLREGKNGD